MRYNIKHGLSNTRFFSIWGGIKKRCTNSRSEGYKKYGSKGIKICKRWKSFLNFRDDMYQSYVEHIGKFGEKNTQIERNDCLGNYTPENCRWATIAEQARNKTNGHLITFRGITKSLTDWSHDLNLRRLIIYKRLKRGWSVNRALTTPKINRSRTFTIDGETRGIYTWARMKGISEKNLWKRLKRGWSIKEALTKPVI